MPTAYQDSGPGVAPLPQYIPVGETGWMANPALATPPPPVQPSSSIYTYTPMASAAPATETAPASSTPAPTYGPTLADITSTPEYKQALQNVQLWNQSQQDQINFDAAWAQKFYNQNLSQIGSGDALAKAADELNRQQGQQSLTTQQQQIQMAKDKAQRDFEQQRKYITEALTGRGNAGGQLGFETNNLKFGYDQFLQGEGLNAQNAQFAYDTLMKQIDLNQQNRDLSNTNARANLDLTYQQQVAQTEQARKTLALQVAQKNGEALLAVESQLAQLWFDPSTGMYRGPGGQQVSVAQAQASLPETAVVGQQIGAYGQTTGKWAGQ